MQTEEEWIGTFYFTVYSFLVETFWIAADALFQGRVYVHLFKVKSGFCMSLSSSISILKVSIFCQNSIFRGYFLISNKELLTFLYGLMKLTKQTTPASAKSLATSPILLMFSSLSSGLNPRSLLRPNRILSPSKT